MKARARRKLPDLLPAHMLNEFAYCPRLFFYEWVEGVFEHNPDTLDGQATHSRVDTEPGAMPTAEELGEEDLRSRSVTLTSDRLGLTAKRDLIESGSPAGRVTVCPVDYKRGKPRQVDGVPEPWPPERIQLAAQVLCWQRCLTRSTGTTRPKYQNSAIVACMTRLRRVVVVNVPHHLTQRGNARQYIPSLCVEMTQACGSPAVKGTWVGGNC